jgi:hypothetical protein
MEDTRGLGLHPQGIKVKSFLYYLQIVFEMPTSGNEIKIRKLEMVMTQFIKNFKFTERLLYTIK